MSTLEEETAKEIMYPGLENANNNEDVRRQYIISHWSYGPGERRKHYGPSFVVPDRTIESGRMHNDNDGNRTKQALYWTEERAKELQTVVVTKRLSDWQKRRRPEIGVVHDPMKDTIEHLQADHIFGIRFPPDDYSVGDLIGYGKAAREALKKEEEKEAQAAANALAKGNDSQRILVSASKKKLKGPLTTKITSTSPPIDRIVEGPAFGVPTIRQKRRPGYMKRLSDNTNYGDELDAKALLIPIPENLYGEDLLAKLRAQFKQDMRIPDDELGLRPLAPAPAKVLPLRVN
ncbi:hypothetical protein HDU97_008209 [Phlyctochytrium planicorne]|nr:hypothetical protein HDU97_008209 [Phlyctochytrium planicorne]